jgi:hypothetical protein
VKPARGGVASRISHSTVTNRCLGKRQARCYDIHVAHLAASTEIKYHHVPAGGTVPPLQSHQIQISSKPRGEKGIGPTCGFTASPEVGLGATIGTLQIGYPRAQDLSLVLQCQTLHPTGKGSSVIACPCGSRPALGAREIWHHHMPRGTRHTTQQGRALVLSCVPRLQPASQCEKALALPHATGSTT